MDLRPVRLLPHFDERPWGARSLAPLFPDKSNLRETIGEAWLTGDNCEFADGPFAGQKLGKIWREMGSEWTGTTLHRQHSFPLLLKFLFTEDKPSVQVHPHDEYAAQNETSIENARGKTEMWYVVAARPGAEVLVGLKPGVNRESFRRSISDGTAEQSLDRIPVQVGDAIFVPAGTTHTIGGGLVLCEIQQNSDITYRVYDYERRDASGKSRPLHIDKAFDVIRFGEQHGGKLDPISIEHGAVTEAYFVACRYFATDRWTFRKRAVAATSPEHFDLFVVIEGRGRFEWGKESAAYERAQVWFIPAGLGAYKIAPASRTTLLHTYVPKDIRDFGRRLDEQGVPETQWSRLIYSSANAK